MINLISLPDMLMFSPVLQAKSKNTLEFKKNMTKLEITTLFDVTYRLKNLHFLIFHKNL